MNSYPSASKPKFHIRKPMPIASPSFPWYFRMHMEGPSPRDLSRVSESTHGLSREFLATLCLCFPCMSVNVSSHRGKLIVGWMLPPETPPEVADAQKKQGQDGFDEVVARSVAHRMPDSIHFNSSPDRGNMWPVVSHTHHASSCIAFLPPVADTPQG